MPQCTWWLYVDLASASNTLQSLSARGASYPDKTLRTCKTETALWEKEPTASLDSPTESNLPPGDCTRQQLATSVLPTPCLPKQCRALLLVFPFFLTSSFFSPCCRACSQAPQLDEQVNQILLPVCANRYHSRGECVPSSSK